MQKNDIFSEAEELKIKEIIDFALEKTVKRLDSRYFTKNQILGICIVFLFGSISTITAFFWNYPDVIKNVKGSDHNFQEDKSKTRGYSDIPFDGRKFYWESDIYI